MTNLTDKYDVRSNHSNRIMKKALGPIKSFFLKKWAILALFFVYFRLFNQTIQFLQQISMKNVVTIK